MAAVPQDAHQTERRQEIDQREEVRAESGLIHRALVHVVGFAREVALLQPLGTEALHDAHTRHALLDHAGQLGKLLLQRHGDGMHAARESSRGDVQERQRREREEGETGTAQCQHDRDGDHRQHARDRQRDQQHDQVDLLDVGVRVRHQLAGLRVIVEREVQPLKVRDEPHAEIRLHAEREPERGVPPQAGADRLDHTNRENDQRPFQGDIEISGNDAVVDRRAGERRDRNAGTGPDQSGENSHPDQDFQRSDSVAHQAPARPPSFSFFVHHAPDSPPAWSRSSDSERYQRRSHGSLEFARGNALGTFARCPPLRSLLRPRPFAPPASC